MKLSTFLGSFVGLVLSLIILQDKEVEATNWPSPTSVTNALKQRITKIVNNNDFFQIIPVSTLSNSRRGFSVQTVTPDPFDQINTAYANDQDGTTLARIDLVLAENDLLSVASTIQREAQGNSPVIYRITKPTRSFKITIAGVSTYKMVNNVSSPDNSASLASVVSNVRSSSFKTINQQGYLAIPTNQANSTFVLFSVKIDNDVAQTIKPQAVKKQM